MKNANQIFSHLRAIYPSKSPLTVPNTLNKVILGSFGTRRPTTASFSHFYQLPKTSPPDIVDSLKKLLLSAKYFVWHTLSYDETNKQGRCFCKSSRTGKKEEEGVISGDVCDDGKTYCG